MSDLVKRAGIAATAGAAILWGTSFPATKYALPSFGDPLFFAAVRVGVAAIVSLLLLQMLGRSDWKIYRSPAIWLIGATNAVGIALQNYGMDMTSASKTVLLVDINVVIVAFLSYWLFKERFGLRKSAGVLAGIIGVVMLAISPDIVMSNKEMLGDFLVFMSGVMYAIFIVTVKKTLGKVNPLEVSMAAITTSAVMLLIPCAIAVPAGLMDSRIDLGGVAPMLYLAVACTTLAYYLWAYGLKRLTATSSSIILLLEVVAGLTVSFALLGEGLSSFAIVGAGFIVVAIILVSDRG
ncbi:MAG TPA: DMT family transporter [Thermoplasmata archaeon]|nr:DMT family transporter [Thermoplasmata archaeon]